MESIYAHWSAENATKAYLKTIKMGIKGPNKEVDESEFISAIAAGNNAQLIVVACGETTTPSTLLALLAAASQTRARVICIFHDLNKLRSTKQALNQDGLDSIEFVVGDAITLISQDYQEADFVLNDCKLENHEPLLRAMQLNGKSNNNNGGIVLGFNAFSTESWKWVGLKTSQVLPIGEGLLVTRILRSNEMRSRVKVGGDGLGRKSHWVVKVDKFTGEEHVFRVRCPSNGKEMGG